MPSFRLPIVTLAAVCMATARSPALADREPTPEERARIEQVLRAEGFTAWDDIELDDDVWEVDDARDADGREYDLKLDPTTFRITGRDG